MKNSFWTRINLYKLYLTYSLHRKDLFIKILIVSNEMEKLIETYGWRRIFDFDFLMMVNEVFQVKTWERDGWFWSSKRK